MAPAAAGRSIITRGQDSRELVRRNVLAWSREIANGGLDAIVINTSGCGTTVKDYGFMRRDDPEARGACAHRFLACERHHRSDGGHRAARRRSIRARRRVAYHSACSLQHAQRVNAQPKKLLMDAGFVVLDPPEGHLCCGSAGTYNLLQPEIATKLRDRKIANIESISPDLIAAGNIGCITQIAAGTALPVVHTVELLDWATGGPRPGAVPA